MVWRGWAVRPSLPLCNTKNQQKATWKEIQTQKCGGCNLPSVVALVIGLSLSLSPSLPLCLSISASYHVVLYARAAQDPSSDFNSANNVSSDRRLQYTQWGKQAQTGDNHTWNPVLSSPDVLGCNCLDPQRIVRIFNCQFFFSAFWPSDYSFLLFKMHKRVVKESNDVCFEHPSTFRPVWKSFYLFIRYPIQIRAEKFWATNLISSAYGRSTSLFYCIRLCLSHSTGYLQSLQTRNWKNLSLKDFIMFKKLLQAVSGASQTLSSTFEGLDSGMNLSMVGVRSCWEAIQSTGTMWRWGQPQCWNSTINYVPISLLAEVKLPSWNCLLSA